MPDHSANRAFPLFIGIFLILIGSLFFWLMTRSFLRALDMRRHWPEVPCLILSSSVEERNHDPQSPLEYRLSLAYAYEWNDQPFIGENLTLRGNPWSSHREKIEGQLAAYPISSRHTCRVNPAHPGTAILKPDSLAPGYSLWFPALFILGGAGIIFGTWKKKKNAKHHYFSKI